MRKNNKKRWEKHLTVWEWSMLLPNKSRIVGNYNGDCAQLCSSLSDLMDCSPPGSSAHGIFQIRILDWKKKKKESWTGLPFPPPGDLNNPGLELTSPACPARAGRFLTAAAHLGGPSEIIPGRQLLRTGHTGNE